MRVLKFTSDKCPPCKTFDLEFENINYKENINITTIKHPDKRFNEYKIGILPTTIQLDDNLEEVDRWHGSYFIKHILNLFSAKINKK